MTKIVFTGGPSAGKSSFIQSLKLMLLDREDVFFAPEIATMLLGQGFPKFTSPENVTFQQRAIFKTQMEMEDLLAKEDRYSLCFFDRGLIDAFAYVDNKNDIFDGSNDLLFKRYDHVFHLEVAPIAGYTQANNKSRTENHKEALFLENQLRKLWSDHKNYSFIKSQGKFSEKVEDFVKVYGSICGLYQKQSKQNLNSHFQAEA